MLRDNSGYATSKSPPGHPSPDHQSRALFLQECCHRISCPTLGIRPMVGDANQFWQYRAVRRMTADRLHCIPFGFYRQAEYFGLIAVCQRAGHLGGSDLSVQVRIPSGSCRHSALHKRRKAVHASPIAQAIRVHTSAATTRRELMPDRDHLILPWMLDVGWESAATVCWQQYF